MWRPKASHRIVFAVLVLAVAARLYGIGWGLPHVYEEAQPLKRAWEMWGWGPDESFDPNPHFFNYPSLAFYVQFAGQAALYAGMRAADGVDSTEDFRVRYHTDPSPFYILGRLINVLFGALTVLLTYRIGRHAGGGAVGGFAALLLAVNLFHASRSQMVEVDVPLTCFLGLTMALLLKLTTSPTRGGYLLAGAAIGLSAATKYTGALLLAPLVVAHFVSGPADARRQPPPGRRKWNWLLLSTAVSVAVFLAASPYVVLDFASFAEDFGGERHHMRLGHFGLGGQSAWIYYPLALGQRLVGWPAVVLALGGLAVSLARREKWSFVLAAFAVPYVAAISSWAMMADRYTLPVLPLVLVYAAFGVGALVDRLPAGRSWRTAAWAAAVIFMAAPLARSVSPHMELYRTDSRTLCLEWLENNVPAGSFVVSEAYGPPLVGPVQFWQVPGDIRERWYEQRRSRPFYSFFAIPLFQMEPEQTEAFYDDRLYREADVLITTDAVRRRYAGEPERYPRHAAFYDSIDSASSRFEVVETIEAGGRGSRITIYRDRRYRPPFASRSVTPPPRLRPELPLRRHWHGSFYYRFAVNYEAFGYLQKAISGYEMALPFTAGDSELYREVTYGMIRCLTITGATERALAFIEQMKASAPTPSDAKFVDNLARGVRSFGERR